jgi:mono/diheme cytochrome c family protein
MKKVFLPQSPLPLVLGCALVLFAILAVRQSRTLVHASAQDPAQTPVQAPATVPSGVVLFHEKGCEHCHGANGVGIPGKGPSLFTVGKRLKKDAIEKQIHDGGQNMPPFGDALQPDEITALVDTLSKQKKAPKHLPPPIPSPTQPNLN